MTMSSPAADGVEGNIDAEVSDTSMASDFSQLQDDEGSEASGDSGRGEDDAPLPVPGSSITGHRVRKGDNTALRDVPRITVESRDDGVSSELQDEEEYRFVSEVPTTVSRIEVQLEDRPGFDGVAFTKVPSDDVAKVMDEMEAEHGEQWFEIMYEDERVDQIPYDELLQLPNGPQALLRYRRGYKSAEDEMASKSRKRQRQLDPDAAYGSDREVEMIYDDDDDVMYDDLDDQPRHSRGRHSATASRNSSSTRRRPKRNSRISQRLLTEVGVTEGSGSDLSAQSVNGRRLRERPPPIINLADDVDELSQDSRRDDPDDEPFNLVLSDIQPLRGAKRRKLVLRKASAHARPARHFRDESIEFEDVRRSGRVNKNRKLMKESMDDEDLFQREMDKVPAAPRVISIREIFQPVREEFKDVHAPICDTCGGGQIATAHKGVFIYCQGCSNAYHKVCLGYRSARDHQVTKVGPDNFVLQCRRCIGLNRRKEPHAPRLNMCQSCHKKGDCCAAFSERKTGKQEEKLRQENGGEDPIIVVSRELINNPAKVLFRCMQCLRAWHFEHLPPLTRSHSDIPSKREQLLAQYSEHWKCKDCLEVQAKVQTIVAWRPVNREKYVVGTTYDDMDEDDIEYFLKWEKKSYAHCVWRPGAWVHGITGAPMRKAFVKREEGANMLPKYDAQEAIPEEYLMADVILAVRYKSKGRATSKDAELARMGDIDEVQVKFMGLGYEEVVWDEPPPKEEQARFAAFEAAFHEYLNGRYFKHESQATFKERLAAFRELDYKTEVHVSKQPEAMKRGQLMDYQLEGLAWLLYKYHRSENAILADEMGLGKTVQIISLIVSLATDQPKIWPFLVVVPNSTCPNWRREIKFWAPELRVVTYHGGKIPQIMAYEHELFPDGSRNMRAHIVVMSYDSAQDEHTRALFRGVQWAGLVVDEGQRLKNDRNLLYGALRAMRIPFRILLTGTPLQNNKRELFNLIQFIDSSKNANDLDEEYQEITAENLPKLHDMIRPYFLRRTKAGVLKFLPPMAHIIVPVTMTVVQERLCKSIMAKNADLIRAIFSRGKLQLKERTGLNNILMQLRKCLCHPFLYSENVEDKTVDAETMRRNMIEASSKLLMLQIMLPKLKERGHRVLIFSQFLNMLDIIEDFLAGLELPFQRLDGTISSLEKQKRIDRYNAPDSEYFAFLLSTRAGGVGINLATADTVIILDPDFNPHQDIQAISRAHRIGQNKKVLCFQLMTKNSAEEKMMQIGRKKMALDHALIESMDVPEDAENDLEGILKHGAEALFSDTQQDAIHYDSASVDKLLDRSHIENTMVDPEGDASSQFAFARVWENDAGDLADDLDVTDEPEQSLQTSVWDSILAERAAEAAAEAAREQQVLGRGGRRSKAVKYTGPTYDGLEDGVDKDGKSDDDGDFVDKYAAKETDDEASDGAVSSDALTLKDSQGRPKKGGGLAGQGKGTKPRTPKSPKTPQSAKRKSDAQSSATKRGIASAPPAITQESTRSGSPSEEVIFAAKKLPVKNEGETSVQPTTQNLSIKTEADRSSVETLPATATASPYFVEAPAGSGKRPQADVAGDGYISQSIPESTPKADKLRRRAEKQARKEADKAAGKAPPSSGSVDPSAPKPLENTNTMFRPTVGRPPKQRPARQQQAVTPLLAQAEQMRQQDLQRMQQMAALKARQQSMLSSANGNGMRAPPTLASTYSPQAFKQATLPSNGAVYVVNTASPSQANLPYAVPFPMTPAQNGAGSVDGNGNPNGPLASSRPARPQQQAKVAKSSSDFCKKCVWTHAPNEPCKPARTVIDIRMRLDTLQMMLKQSKDVDVSAEKQLLLGKLKELSAG